MQEQVIISHRGARYEIGRGPGYYAIWPAGVADMRSAGAPGPLPPIEWWPETPAGWHDAWARFTDVEGRRTIREVTPPAGAAGPDWPGAAPVRPGQSARSGRGAVVAAALLAVGIACGLAGLFPGYFGRTSLTAQADELVPHVIYLAAWAASAVLLLLGGSRQRAGALLATGTTVVTAGLFLADLGTAMAGGANLVGTGLVLSLAGWIAAAAGSATALATGRTGAPRRPRTLEALLTAALAGAAAVGAAIAFAPSWDRFTLRTATGASQTITAGNAFANPGLVIAGDVIVMAALVIVVVMAAAWRPVRLGAALLAGAAVPMIAQAISALIQIRGATSPLQFGIAPGQAARMGLQISPSLTTVFWVYCAFVIALALTCALMLATPSGPPPAPAPSGPQDPRDLRGAGGQDDGQAAGIPLDAAPASGPAPDWTP